MTEVRDAMHGLMREVAEKAEDARAVEREHGREVDGLLRSVMDLADSVDRVRATAHAEDAEALQVLSLQVQELLADQGLAPYRPVVGDQVDPAACDAIAAVVRPGLRPGTVTAVIRPGYRSGERIVRRAGVEIVKEQA